LFATLTGLTGKDLTMKQNYWYRSPRRITWSIVTTFSAIAMLGISIIVGAIWGLVKALQQLPWTGG
jgi:hypothetical protein